MEKTSLEVEVVRAGEHWRVTVRGELDLGGVPELDAALAGLEGATVADLLLDLRGVTFIDSSGIRSVLDAYHRSRSRGVELSILAGLEVEVVFGLAGLSGRLPFVAAADPEAGRAERAT